MTASEPVPYPSRVVFVLDRPREPMNVGAVIRLMGNFGLEHLRLVRPAAFDPSLAARMARRGDRVLSQLAYFDTLPAAIADCGLVVGTTRRPRALNRPVLSPAEAAHWLLAETADPLRPARTGSQPFGAVLFGPEDFGLANSALDRCHAIVTIPTRPEDASLNLAQAALIIAYEVFLAATALSPTRPGLPSEGAWPGAGMSVAMSGAGEPLALSSELEALFDAARRMLQALHSPPIEGRTNAALGRLRALLLRAGPRQDEVAWLQDLFEHLARAVDRKPETDR